MEKRILFFTKEYVVVRFGGGEESVAVVPSSWISEDKLSCKWPLKKFSTERITRLVMSLSKPSTEWKDYPITVMHAYDNYRKARKACKLAEDNSNLDTAAGETDLEERGSRKKRKTKHWYDSEESSDEPPRVIKKRVMHSDKHSDTHSDEDDISTAQKIKQAVKALRQEKRTSTFQHPTSFLSLKHSSKDAVVKSVKPPTYANLSSGNEVNSAIDSCVAINNTALPSTSFSIDSPFVSETSEKSFKSMATINTLSENDSNKDDTISSKDGILRDTDSDTFGKTSFAKTLLSQTSVPTMNDNTCEMITILLKVLIEQIEGVSGKLDHVNMSLTRVYKKLLPEDPAPIKPKDLPNLPLRDEEAFHTFDKFLQNDDNFLATIDYFVLLMPTGKTEEAIPVGKLLARIFSNSLARIVNYTGSGSVKLKLQDTNILTAIQCAIVTKFPSSDVTQIQSKILRWFCTSNQRKMNTIDMT